MKTRNLKIVLIISVLLVASFSLQGQIKKSYRGVWDVSAPDSPPGYQIAEITITKDSVFSKYPDDPYVYPSKSTSFKKDTFTYLYNPGIDVSVSITSVNKTTLTGMAKWESGESVCTFTKKQSFKSKKQKSKSNK